MELNDFGQSIWTPDLCVRGERSNQVHHRRSFYVANFGFDFFKDIKKRIQLTHIEEPSVCVITTSQLVNINFLNWLYNG